MDRVPEHLSYDLRPGQAIVLVMSRKMAPGD
jgi:hypothetical protein